MNLKLLQKLLKGIKTTSDEHTYSCSYINGLVDSIIEKGDNANGTYIKFANGILINMKAITGTSAASLWDNYTYYKDVTNGSWALPFVQLINCQVTNNTNQYWAIISGTSITSAGTTRFIRPSAGSSESSHYNAHIFAIGTWK